MPRGSLAKRFSCQEVRLPRGSLLWRSAFQEVCSSGSLLIRRLAHQEVHSSKVRSPRGSFTRRLLSTRIVPHEALQEGRSTRITLSKDHSQRGLLSARLDPRLHTGLALYSLTSTASIAWPPQPSLYNPLAYVLYPKACFARGRQHPNLYEQFTYGVSQNRGMAIPPPP